MIYYIPETQILGETEKTKERRYFRLPSGGVVTAEAWEDNQLRIVEVVSTDLNDYMNSRLRPGSILHLLPEFK